MYHSEMHTVRDRGVVSVVSLARVAPPGPAAGASPAHRRRLWLRTVAACVGRLGMLAALLQLLPLTVALSRRTNPHLRYLGAYSAESALDLDGVTTCKCSPCVYQPHTHELNSELY